MSFITNETLKFEHCDTVNLSRIPTIPSVSIFLSSLFFSPSLFFTLPTNFSTTCPSAPSPHFYLPVSFHFLLLRVLLNLLLHICLRFSLFLRSWIVAPPRLSSPTLPWPTPLRFFSSFSHFNHPHPANLLSPLPFHVLFRCLRVRTCASAIIPSLYTPARTQRESRVRVSVST